MALRQSAGDIDGTTTNPIRGTGDFKVEKYGTTGHYRIKFEPPFRRIVSVVAAPYTRDVDNFDKLVILNYGDDECRLFTGDSQNHPAERSFSFIAVGE